MLETTFLEAPQWAQIYGYQENDTVGVGLYLLALSPFCMLDTWGEPCGLNLAQLAKQLGVNSVEVLACSTAMQAFGGYNRTWECRNATTQMYDRGSVFRIRCDVPPTVQAVQSVQQNGLGIRQAEGFGQVLFVRPELMQNVCKKAAADQRRLRADSAGKGTPCKISVGHGSERDRALGIV